jgi:predicted ATP-dependent protease
VRFADALSAALRQILGHWDKPRALVPAGVEAAEGDDEALRRFVIARMLDPVAAAGPEVVRPYLARLAAALEAYAAAPGAPQVVEADLPAGRLQAPPIEGVAGGPAAADGPASALGAPVIVASLARMDLARSLVRANGGVLVLNAAELIERDQPNAEWATLRAALRSESIPMRGTGEPQVPLAVRVALVGGYAATRVLERADDFLRLFRYKALFEDDADWTRAAEAAYAALADEVARRYALPAFAGEAVGALVEEGARRTPGRNRSRVSTDVLALRDVALEAGRRALARPDLGAPATTEADVAAALAARRARHGVAGRDAREEILLGREIVPTAGAAVGQVNGLSVISPVTVEGRYSTPLRLTATVSPARDEQLLDIEREADLADSSHVTGSLTMAGYLAWRYGGQRPISLTVRLRFEQEILYSAGPSASGAELFAVLSALAGVPIRAALAVTGAVGQHGEIQPIGGVNDKIEGFWEICRRRRAQGEEPVGAYGVLIPAANTADLMLRPEVAASIAGEGWFHVWPIAEVDEGLELLTGLPAGEIHARADRRLQQFYELAQRHGR